MAQPTSILPAAATSNFAAYMKMKSENKDYDNKTYWAFLAAPNITSKLPTRSMESLEYTVQIRRGTNQKSSFTGQNMVDIPAPITGAYDEVVETMYRQVINTMISRMQKRLPAFKTVNDDDKAMAGYILAADENIAFFNNAPLSCPNGAMQFMSELSDTTNLAKWDKSTSPSLVGIYDRIMNPGTYHLSYDTVIQGSGYDLRPTAVSGVQNIAVQAHFMHIAESMGGSLNGGNTHTEAYMNEDVLLLLKRGWVGNGNGQILAVDQNNYEYHLDNIEGIKLNKTGRYTPDVTGNQYTRMIPNNPDINGSPWGGVTGKDDQGNPITYLDVPMSFTAGTGYAKALPSSPYAGQPLYSNIYFLQIENEEVHDYGDVKEIKIGKGTEQPHGVCKLQLPGGFDSYTGDLINQEHWISEGMVGIATPNPRCVGLITGFKVAQ
jgi:hypothetical protein